MTPASASSSSPSDRRSESPEVLPVAYPLPDRFRSSVARTDIWKMCFECAGYYKAQLDGEYRCPRCRREGRASERAMAPLDGSLEVMPEAMAPVPRRPPSSILHDGNAPRRAAGGV